MIVRRLRQKTQRNLCEGSFCHPLKECVVYLKEKEEMIEVTNRFEFKNSMSCNIPKISEQECLALS